MDRGIAKEVADVVVWLDRAAIADVLRLLLRGERGAVFDHLLRVAPDLDPGLRANDDFYELLLDEVELRVSPSEDPDDLETREIPDYARFARGQTDE